MKSITKYGILLLLIGAVAGVLTLRSLHEQGGEEEASTQADAAPLDGEEAPLPRLLELGADKCIPCKAMMPILAELRQEYADALQVDFIDIWKNQEAGGEYGVQMIPTQIFFDSSGKELFRHTGFFSKEDILAKWKELGVELQPAP